MSKLDSKLCKNTLLPLFEIYHHARFVFQVVNLSKRSSLGIDN
jgi:hypothetical protein